MAWQLPISPLALLPLLLLLGHAIYARLTRRRTAFDDLPWAGLPSGWLPQLRAALVVRSRQDEIESAWDTYTSKDKGFVWQTFLGGPMLILPPSQAHWLLDLPDTIVSGTQAQVDILGLGHTLRDRRVTDYPIHEKVIRTDLTRAVGSTIDQVRDELHVCFREVLGDDGQWHSVSVWPTTVEIFARTSVRIFCGKTLSHTPDFIDNLEKFATSVPRSGIPLRPFPGPVRDLISRWLLRDNQERHRLASAYLLPLIDERKAAILQHDQSQSDTKLEEPNDLLQWNIRNSLSDPDPSEHLSSSICNRLLGTFFAAIHTTALTSSNVLFDLAAADPADNILGELRDEVDRVYAAAGNRWTKASLAQLVRVDSAIKESMRLRVVAGYGAVRKVMARDGLTTPDGHYVPYGAHLGLSAWGNHTNAETYSNPYKYDAFRFSRFREELSTTDTHTTANQDGVSKRDTPSNVVTSEKNVAAETLRDRQAATVSTSSTFLSFGHGRHACPGRFFAIMEVKLLLAELLLLYDIEQVPTRPPTTWISEAQIPNTTASLSFKRRQTAAAA